MLGFNLLPAWAAVLGLLSHWTYFIHGEHHLKAPLYACLFLTLLLPLYLLESCLHKNDISHPFKAVLEVLAAYLIALFASITVYRLVFHRLHRFPGPLGAQISKLWHTWQVRHANNHQVLDKLYHEYGTFVRTGNHSRCSWSALTLMTLKVRLSSPSFLRMLYGQ